jgi:hypothetical protein
MRRHVIACMSLLSTNNLGETMRVLLAAVLTCLASSASFAEQSSTAATSSSIVTSVQTAADLAAVCDPSWSGVPRLEAIAYCQGFLTSAGQYHTQLHPAGGRVRPLYCLPTPGPTIAQSGIAYAAWVRANPAHSSEPALDGLLRWAQATFPCPPAASAARAPRPAR